VFYVSAPPQLRGAYNRISQLPADVLAAGVVTASAGNHAQGVALSAQRLGLSAVICMPVTTPAIKVDSVKRMGATVRLVGDTFDETNAFARDLAASEGRAFIPPFDDPDVIAGQGTVGMEILRQVGSKPLHAIFVPVGGGGLIAGIAAYVKCVRPDVLVIGVEPAGANAMAQSLRAGRRVTLSKVDGFADGVAVKTVGKECFRIARETVDGTVLVDTDAICAAIKDVFEDTRSILEPAGALALAGAKAYLAAQGSTDCSVVAVTSGANMNFDRLRLVSELADVGLRQEAVLATTIPETPGAFKRFAAAVSGDATGGDADDKLNITEFKYRYAGAGPAAQVLYSVALRGPAQLERLLGRLAGAEMPTVDLSSNELAKVHIRHLVGAGGGGAALPHERLLKVEFPEKPGALGRFLDALSPRWNISLFHYRNAGGNVAKVLVGLQVPPAEADAFATALAEVGYDFADETDNPAFRLLQPSGAAAAVMQAQTAQAPSGGAGGATAEAEAPKPKAGRKWPWQKR
jgi:threonine dehydratase